MGGITVTITNTASGAMPQIASVVAVDVSKEFNRIPRAEIVLIDGGLAVPGFPLSDDPFFNPGEEIQISLRHEGAPESEAVLFVGIVVKQRVRADCTGTYLNVSLKDKAVGLTHGRRSVLHKELTDTDIIKAIIGEKGLSPGIVDPTTATHPEMTQFNSSDWDFIILRAEANGLLVGVDDGVVSAKKIDLSTAPIYSFEYGLDSISNFDIEADSELQFAAVQSTAWSIADQALTAPTEGADMPLKQGASLFSPPDIGTTLGNESLLHSNPVPLLPEELQAWADNSIQRARLAFIRGSLTVPGVGDIKPFDIITVAGMGDKFNGNALVSGVRHRVTVEGGWVTDIQLGLSAESHASKFCASEPQASGLLPGIQGLHIGVVAAFEEDPEKELRVKTILPGVGEAADTIWARLASPDAGVGRGFFFRPEVGDEVVVGFFNNDPRQAVILGSLYSSKNTPFDDWAAATEDNQFKGIASKLGARIEFIDGDAPQIIIATPGGNYINLDENGGAMELADQNGNIILMDANGITITSAGDFIVDAASGNVEISGSAIDLV
ncbi:MAG: type IV secretion protein Rhs [Alteromonadaceae bacterium]|nr:MAG: type IV secretion protein Rhs [Alteromonadaceae bacterium]